MQPSPKKYPQQKYTPGKKQEISINKIKKDSIFIESQSRMSRQACAACKLESCRHFIPKTCKNLRHYRIHVTTRTSNGQLLTAVPYIGDPVRAESKKTQTYITSVNAPQYQLPLGILRARLWLSTLITGEDLRMYTPCPSCNSGRVITKNLGKQTGGLIGAAGGAASGAAGALSGAEAGAVLGVVGGPVGIAIGSIAGAILGGLFGGVAGGIAGATLGEQIDDKVLANYQCLKCGYSFSVNR